MANIFRDFWIRLKVDYQEYRAENIDIWTVKRETRHIERAQRRAQIMNKKNGRTYYILKDKRGAISALTSDEIKYWTMRGYFPKWNYEQRLRHTIAIVTSNRTVQEQYNQVQLKKENHE